MATYNLMRKADRDRYRSDHVAELRATQEGTWPRDLNDRMRWIRSATPEHAAGMCREAIAYVDDLEVRIRPGDPDLACYER